MSTAPANAAASAPLRPLQLERLTGSQPSELSLGQIVKARVLRHYEGERYLVSLDGRERVVDSSVPLKTGELIRGKVVAVGDRVELQPLPEASVREARADAAPAAPADELTATFAQFGLKLDDGTRSALLRALKGAADPQAAVLAAMTLAKIGLPQEPALLDAVQALLRRRPAASAAGEGFTESFSINPGAPLAAQLHEVLRAALAAGNTTQTAEAAGEPAQVASGAADNGQTADQGGSGAGSGAGSESKLGQWVLNSQTGGAVVHRVGTLPLLLGGRLVEVDVALFEQDARQSRQGEPRARHLVFVLDTQTLGGVEVSARLVDSRLRVRFAADRDATLELLAGRREELSRQLAQLGFTVDEITYETRTSAAQNPAYRAVADYVVTQGSLDRKV
jgi:hypothetical protein